MLSLTISCCYGSKKIGEGQATCGALDDDDSDDDDNDDDSDDEDVDLVVRRTGCWRIIRRAEQPGSTVIGFGARGGGGARDYCFLCQSTS